jgi:hypothetical protein
MALDGVDLGVVSLTVAIANSARPEHIADAGHGYVQYAF